MTHDVPLITTIVTGLCLAFVFGLLAHRLRLPLIAGYLLAGVVLGPFTPGYVADLGMAQQLSEIGVIRKRRLRPIEFSVAFSGFGSWT